LIIWSKVNSIRMLARFAQVLETSRSSIQNIEKGWFRSKSYNDVVVSRPRMLFIVTFSPRIPARAGSEFMVHNRMIYMLEGALTTLDTTLITCRFSRCATLLTGEVLRFWPANLDSHSAQVSSATINPQSSRAEDQDARITSMGVGSLACLT